MVLALYRLPTLGLQRTLTDWTFYVAQSVCYIYRLLPLRWTAPEAIKMSVFSTASDVFSFGIVTIEVYTHAVCPYLQWSDAEVMRQVAEG